MSRIHFLNVEEGDCSIIEHEDGKVSMIDICCGNIEKSEDKTFSANESTGGVKGNFHQKEHPNNPISYLRGLGIKDIFRYIQTHPDMDHMDGLLKLYESVPILNFWDTENTKEQAFDENGKSGRYIKEDWDCYQKLRKSKEAPKALFYYDGAKNKYYAEDDNGTLQDDYLQILSPTKQLINEANKAGDWNDSSYVILYCSHGFKILFCGDADMGTINHLLKNHIDEVSNLDVLVAPHHGRDSDKDFHFLDVMKPKLTLFGNAQNKFLAHGEWDKREFEHITNNQAGNILIEIEPGCLHVSASNQKFAENYCNQNWGDFTHKNNAVTGYWRLFKRNK